MEIVKFLFTLINIVWKGHLNGKLLFLIWFADRILWLIFADSKIFVDVLRYFSKIRQAHLKTLCFLCLWLKLKLLTSFCIELIIFVIIR